MNYIKHKIVPAGHVEICEQKEDGTLHRSVIAPNQPLDKYNDIIEADKNFDKYRTQENADEYEKKLSESDDL